MVVTKSTYVAPSKEKQPFEAFHSNQDQQKQNATVTSSTGAHNCLSFVLHTLLTLSTITLTQASPNSS